LPELLGALPSPRRARRRFWVPNASQNTEREARMKHLLRFLGLAAGLAVAAGMVLAGIALVLAMPAYAGPFQ